MIIPAPNKYRQSTDIGSLNFPMVNPSTEPPAAITSLAISYELKPAINTPIKLTKSFPANERANAAVPANMIMRKIFTLNTH